MARNLFGRRLDAEKDYSILVGRTTVSGKLVRGRKAQKKAQALPQSGMARSEARYSGSLQEMGAKGGKRRRKNGHGKEVLSSTFSVKANEIEVTSE